jgi:hypothetical protein
MLFPPSAVGLMFSYTMFQKEKSRLFKLILRKEFKRGRTKIKLYPKQHSSILREGVYSAAPLIFLHRGTYLTIIKFNFSSREKPTGRLLIVELLAC